MNNQAPKNQLKIRLINWLVDHSLSFMACNTLLALLIGYGMTQLYLESDYRIFFDKDDPNLIAESFLEETYGKSDNILFILEPANNNIFTRENLATLESLTNLAWQIPHSSRVDSVTNFQHPYVDGDDIFVEDLVENAAAYTDADIQRIRQVALDEIGLVRRLISETGAVAAVNVTMNLPEAEKTAAIAEAVQAARDMQESLETADSNLKVYLSGLTTTEQTFTDVAGKDATTLIPAMFLIILVLLTLFLRSVFATLCTLIIITTSIFIGLGFAGWYGFALNNVNISAPTIIMTLAIADCMHIFRSFMKQLSLVGDKTQALKNTLDINIYPVFLTSITTAFGFLTMNFSESPPFRELGSISAVGVAGAFWLSIGMLPGMIRLLPFSAKNTDSNVENILRALGEFVVRNYRRLFFACLAIILVSTLFITRLELNDNTNIYFSHDVPLRQASELIENKLSGTQIIYYSLSADREDGILEPNFLTSVEKFVDWLRDQPDVVNVESFTDTLKRLNQILHEDKPDWYKLPDGRQLSAQYFLMYELSVPYGLDINNQVSRNKSSLKITATLKNLKSSGLIDFQKKSSDWLTGNLPEVSFHIGGQSLSFAHIGQRNIVSMLLGSLTAVALISASLIFIFKSIRYGLISFIPNIFPALMTLGIWTAMVGEVNMAASVVFSLTLGIIVDDTIHFMVKYINARRSPGGTAASAIKYAFTSVGDALLSTSVILASGFLVLALSDFMVNSTSGLLVSMTIAIAIILDLLFLPSVLLMMPGESRARTNPA